MIKLALQSVQARRAAAHHEQPAIAGKLGLQAFPKLFGCQDAFQID